MKIVYLLIAHFIRFNYLELALKVMRKLLLLVLSVLLMVMSFSACKSSLPKRFDSFVTSVENNYASFSEEDWTKANERFEKLFNEYKANRSSYNSEEKKIINSALARYAKVVVKSGIDDVIGVANDIYSTLPSLIDGAKSLLNELGISGSDKK